MREFVYRRFIQQIPLCKWLISRVFRGRFRAALFGMNTAAMEGETQKLFLRLKQLAEEGSPDDLLKIKNSITDLTTKMKKKN